MTNVVAEFTKLLPKTIGWEPYAHLVWLVFLLFQPFSDPTWTLTGWFYTALMVALFLPIYLWTWCQGERRVRWGIVGIALLGLVFVHINSGASSFFIYAAAAAGFSGPPRFAFKVVAGIWGLVIVSAFLSPIPWPFVLYAFIPPLIMTAMIGGINIFEAEKSRANAKLHLAHEEIEHLATIAERERIARDLHDLLGHTLSVITLKSELASRLSQSDPARAALEAAEVAQVSREALREVREAVRGYRKGGLAGEVQGAKRALGAAGVSFTYHADPIALSPAQESTLALALREAATNVVRHAGATRCTARLFQQGDVIRLTVEDDGCADAAPEGAGLLGMRERAEALGGSLRRGLEGGTQLTLSLPGGIREP